MIKPLDLIFIDNLNLFVSLLDEKIMSLLPNLPTDSYEESKRKLEKLEELVKIKREIEENGFY